MAGVTTETPATHGYLPQLRADWLARGWDLDVLDSFRMTATPPAGEGGDGPNPAGANPPPAPANPPAQPPAAPPAPSAGGDLDGLQSALDTASSTGRTEALQPLMQAIGVDTPEALQEWVTERQAEIDAGKDEATRAREQAERDAAEARAQAAQATADARDARIEAALAAAGAPGDNVADLRLLVQLADDADRDAITTAVETVKGKYPALFSAAATPPSPPAPPHGGSRPGQPTPPQTGEEAGRKRAQQYKQRHQQVSDKDLIDSFTPSPSPFATN